MGTWQISPSSSIASINENTGEASFGEHTSDITYTISYTDSTCGTITKSFTVKKCGGGGGCTCDVANFSVTGKTITPGTNVVIAEYTADCDDDAEVRNEGGDDFLNVSDAHISNGRIVLDSVDSVTSNKRGDYAVYVDNTRCNGFSVTQNADSPSGCSTIRVKSNIYNDDVTVTYTVKKGSTTVGTLSTVQHGLTQQLQLSIH